MKHISFREMYQTPYHLRNLFIMNQYWEENETFYMRTNRRTSALFFLRNCDAIYEFSDGSQQTFLKGSLLYLPQGAMYKTTFLHVTKQENVDLTVPASQLLEFELFDDQGIPFIASDEILLLDHKQTKKYEEALDELLRIYSAPIFHYALLQSEIFRLLNDISYQMHAGNIFSKKFSPIAPGILYLEQNTTHDLSIGEIADMCHVSETCFRRLFRLYSGYSPVEYLTHNKMQQAIKLLQNHSMTITDVANSLGYEDPAYFSRVFKKYTGKSPSAYQ